jgi:hypothetical protein
MSAANINFFFLMQTQIKLYHWQTRTFSRHKATDTALSSLADLVDKYVEVYIGKYGRPRLDSRTNSTQITNMSEPGIVKFIRRCTVYIGRDLTKGLKESDTDLFSLRDEMLAELNQLLYLFTLH